MVAPGVNVSVSASPTPNSNPAPTGTWFVAGMAERGPVGSAVVIQSMSDFAAKLGNRVSYSVAYDAVDAFFREGGNTVQFSRFVGPAAAQASHTFVDRAGTPLNTLVVKAAGPGSAGNNISVAVVNGPIANTFQLQVTYSGVLVETSTVCGAPADAVAWAAAKSNYVTITDSGSLTVAPNNNPAVVAAQALTGGTDDTASVTDTQRTAALTAFTNALGPGQVSCPGATSSTVITALFNHAAANNRVALADAPDTATAATITTLASTVQAAVTDSSYGTILAPWVTYPAIPTGTVVVPPARTIPPSALVAGLMARSDAATHCNTATAGPNGTSKGALGVSQTYVDSDRDALNSAGVCVVRNIASQGGVQLYGFVSLAADPSWTDLANVRFRMQLVTDALAIGAGYEFATIDGAGKVLAAFNGSLVGNLTKYWAAGACYGATPSDAFSVNTGSAVNTPTTIGNRELHAVEAVKMSPTAQAVYITIVRYPVTTPVAA